MAMGKPNKTVDEYRHSHRNSEQSRA